MSDRHRGKRGLTLVELLVAICIGSVVGLAVTQELVMAHRARRTGAEWMRATQIATECLERLRSGDRPAEGVAAAGFTVSWQTESVLAYPDLKRAAVTVVWHDDGEKRFDLEAFIPEAP